MKQTNPILPCTSAWTLPRRFTGLESQPLNPILPCTSSARTLPRRFTGLES